MPHTHATQPDYHSPKTVLHVRVISNAGGGPDKTIFNSPKYIDSTQYRTVLAYIHPKNYEHAAKLRRLAKDKGCELYLIEENHALDIATFINLYKLCKKLNVSIWHGHDYKSNVLGWAINKLHNMNLITTAHGWTNETWRTRLYRKIDQWVIRKYQRVIAVSNQLKTDCLNAGVKENNLQVIHNAIETDLYHPATNKSQARQSLNLTDKFTIGIVGRLSYEKGIDRLLPVIKQLTHKHQQLQILIVGDGPEQLQLEQIINQLGLSEHIIFTGWANDVKPWYAAMDLLIQPSRTEGLPNSLLEAMLLGIPVAATPVGGVGDLIKHEIDGVLLDQMEESWFSQIDKLITNNEYRLDLGKSGVEKIKLGYDFKVRMTKMVAEYNRLTGIEHEDATRSHLELRSIKTQDYRACQTGKRQKAA